MTAESLSLLTNFTRGMHDPLAELAEIIVERKRGSDTEPLHDCKAGAIRETESLVRMLTEDSPRSFFVGWSDSNNGSRGLV